MQLENALLWIIETYGRVTDCNALQPENAATDIKDASGIDILKRLLHPVNVPLGIASTFGMFTDKRLIHPEKAAVPVKLWRLGSDKYSSADCLINALLPAIAVK